MNFLTAYHTDKGIRKKINQDALLINIAKTRIGNVALFAVCDGMGGLEQGEVASSTVIRGLRKWFDNELKELINNNMNSIEDAIVINLEEYIKELNERILQYGKDNNFKLGTTVSALLVIDNKYYIFHIGDSRVYEVTDGLLQLTNDQTLVAREIKRGNLTMEEAKFHPRRNVLLQCVGGTKVIEPEVISGYIKKDAFYILCSDGFYHQLNDEDILNKLKSKIKTEKDMKKIIFELIELVKERKEVDNITAMVIKVI